MKFCIIGAGVSGICIGYFFKLMDLDFQIVEPSFRISIRFCLGLNVDGHIL